MDASGKIPRYSTPRQSASKRQTQGQRSAFDRLVAAAQSLPPAVPREQASYTPFAAGAVRCLPMTNPSLENCLTRLQNAYHVDFNTLADRIDYAVGGVLHESIKITTFELIRECYALENRQLRPLAKRLETLYHSTEAGLSKRVDKNKLAFIVTIYLLEQKAQLEGAATSTGMKPLSPASVLREFFHMLQADTDFTSTPIICKAVKAFLDEHANLCDELQGCGSGPEAPDFSDLCFDDIPGAVASAELRKQLQELSQQYRINFTRFIEAIGDCKRRKHFAVHDPVQKAMTVIGMKSTSVRLVLNASDSYLDRNAKLVITAMNYFQSRAISGENPQPIPLVTGVKRSSERLPVQKLSVTDQKMAEVVKQFATFFLTTCVKVDRGGIAHQVNRYISENWPRVMQPDRSWKSGKFW